MASFKVMLILGVGLLFLTLIFVNEGLPSACADDSLVCPDGSIVGRDSLNDCEFFDCPNLKLLPYCSEGVSVVEVSGDLIRTVSSLEGAGFSVYGANSTRCPLVSPSMVSNECTDLLDLDWESRVNCSSVDYWSFECPTNAFVAEDYVWINCEPGLFPEYEDYCQPAYRQWIELNCDIDVIN